ncbi:uncharacterized protein ABDE67_016445 [Symphorus nematophorus]
MTTEKPKWWKAFLPKKKTGGPKDNASSQSFDQDFDPFAPQPQKPRTTCDQSSSSQQEPNNCSDRHSDDTYDDSHLESVFNEQTCRRNIKISRSGRFRDKRRIRSGIPLEQKETETGASEKEDIR